jgi:hypothetical protein
MLRHAFKEWAVICQALAEGRQSLILRKGGIEEIGTGFRVEHERFWLFPTYTHQQATGIVETARPLLEQVVRDQPPQDLVRLSHFAVVEAVHPVLDLDRALALEGLHLWSAETVRMRFAYRRPGLFVLAVRLHALPQPQEVANTPVYDGCRSWVELEQALPTAEARPVLGNREWERQFDQLRQRLG